MEVHFTHEQEALLTQLAAQVGIKPERLVLDVILSVLENGTHLPNAVPELPRWNLGVTGPLSRRDLYDDVG